MKQEAIDHAYAIIMAGGKGERFWPLSTSKRPKQMLSLVGGRPMLGTSVERMQGLIPSERVIVITSADLAEVAQESAPELPAENIIGEPFGRDTAAACALGTALVRQRDENGIVCILTADHVIRDVPRFQQLLTEGIRQSASGERLVTIGIEPEFPSTGFGYIESAEAIEGVGEIPFFKAKRFVEKPDRETAEKYLAAGNYCWNSGMFIWSAAMFMEELRLHQPALAEMAERVSPSIGTPDFDKVLEEEYGKLEKISVDYAIMEKTERLVMARCAFGWSDVGSWEALEDHFEKDAAGNVLIGKAETVDASGNVVVSDERLTALIGVKDLVVVQAPGATLVCPKDRAQDVKQMVRLLGEKGDYTDLL